MGGTQARDPFLHTHCQHTGCSHFNQSIRKKYIDPITTWYTKIQQISAHKIALWSVTENKDYITMKVIKELSVCS